jgi:hypothetical protein
VTLLKSIEVVGAHLFDVAPVNEAVWNKSSCNESFEPVGGVVVVLIVIGP